MSAADPLPEGLSLDDLALPPAGESNAPAAGHSATEHVQQGPPTEADHGFAHTHADHHPVDHAHETHHSGEAQPSLDGFVEGWQLGLYRDAVFAGSLAAAALAVLGVFIVLRRAVFAAATVGQAAGLGVVVAFYSAIHFGLGLPPLLGALVFAGMATTVLAVRPARRKLPQDAILGLGFLIASGGAVALGDRISQEAHEVSSILFGTAVVVSSEDLVLLAGLFLVVVALVLASWRGVAFAGFDPEGAEVQGLAVRSIDLGFWALVAIALSIATRVIGALPAFAFSVLPALAAILATKRLATTLLVSGTVGALCAALGYVAAYFQALPVGASQTLCCALALGVTMLATTLAAHLARKPAR